MSQLWSSKLWSMDSMLLAKVFGGSLVMRLDRVRLVWGLCGSVWGQSWILVRGATLLLPPPLIDFWQWC